MNRLRVTLLATALMLATFGGIAVGPVGPVNAVDATSVAAVARPSTPQGTPDQAGSKTLTFLSFNMCKSTCDEPAPYWSVRRDRIASVISESGASVVGVQEALGHSGSSLADWERYQEKYGELNLSFGYAPRPYVVSSQWADIDLLSTPAGYVSPIIDSKLDDCVKVRGTQDFVYCTTSPRIFFKDSVVTQMVNAKGKPAAGITRLGLIAPGVSNLSNRRAVAWAYFESPGTGPFLAVSLHMTNAKSVTGEADRNTIARRLGPWADNLNAQMGINAATTVLMADLNSFKDRQPRGAQFTLSKNGWKDAWNAKKRINIQYSTINVTPDTRKFGGWPLKPHMRWDKGVGTRIDYIFAKGPAAFMEYEVMLWTNKNGTFNTDYQASDHQAIRAVVQFN
jgi:endonuclease/exonuclease/phosphatase family metal-dependent hydrolase